MPAPAGHNYGGGGDESAVGAVGGVVDSLPSTRRAAAGLPVVLTEWSSSYAFTVAYHDEPASAPFIVAAVAAMDGLLDASSVRVLYVRVCAGVHVRACVHVPLHSCTWSGALRVQSLACPPAPCSVHSWLAPTHTHPQPPLSMLHVL